MTARRRRMTHVVLACIILITRMLPAFSSSRVTIVVVFSRDATPYQQALKGFTEVLEGKPYRLEEFYLGGPVPRDRLVGKIRARRPDLILTIGSSATDFICDEIRDIPIVFSLVLPSTGEKELVSKMAEHGGVAGASMEIPVETQFLELKRVLPDLKRVGVLYDPDVTGELVANAGKVADKMGFELVPISVESDQEVVRQAEQLSEQVDVLWSVADSTVFSPHGLKQILLSTLRNRVPFVGLSPSFVKAGALLAFSVDYRDVGRQSGELAVRVLAGEDPSSLSLATPRSLSLSVNMNTARQIDVEIRDEVRKRAELFF